MKSIFLYSLLKLIFCFKQEFQYSLFPSTLSQILIRHKDRHFYQSQKQNPQHISNLNSGSFTEYYLNPLLSINYHTVNKPIIENQYGIVFSIC